MGTWIASTPISASDEIGCPCDEDDDVPGSLAETQFAICDSHHHLWSLPGKDYLLPDLLADAAGVPQVAKTVHVEWRSHYRPDGPEHLRVVGETSFAAEAALSQARPGFAPCAGIVGFADLRLGARVDEVLEAHILAGAGHFRGLRYVASWDEDPDVLGGTAAPGPGLYGERDFREGFARLSRFGLTFDAWLFQTQLDDVAALADAFPDQPIVLNHVGGVLGSGPYAGQKREMRERWRASLAEVARRPNVWLKLGGLGMTRCGIVPNAIPGESEAATVARAWRPWIEPAIALFGADRCMFESNFPVDKPICAYDILWEAFHLIVRAASAGERKDLFCRTAERFYRI
ncbi:MAG TPA: amidohydrolase family protein [Bosea sp. (in: a-proteobacteria)]|jgi:predicted TIM-barrel fold metal-dependent hydrolase|nr:amidohydrolase family protein [Bosea sp. (in: a-proteobacteria)]